MKSTGFGKTRKKVTLKGILLISSIFITLTQAQPSKSDIGTFDIGKVQQAVLDQKDSGTNSSAPITKKEAESYTWVILRMTLYLAIVIGVILAVAWIVKKIGIGNSSRIGGGGSMDILEALQFGQNRNAILVRVMDTVYLLGQTPTSIVLLEKIEGQKAIDLIASSKGGGGSVMQFKDVFNNFMGKNKK
jgi:flagellar biosynthetic protein FliO